MRVRDTIRTIRQRIGGQLLDGSGLPNPSWSLAGAASGTASGRGLRVLLFVGVVGGVLLVEPALAEPTNPICADETGRLVGMIEGFIQITLALGIMGLLVVWQADSVMEMFMLDPEKKTRFKRHKWGTLKSAGILVLLGPLFSLAGSMMGLPIAECISLMPV